MVVAVSFRFVASAVPVILVIVLEAPVVEDVNTKPPDTLS